MENAKPGDGVKFATTFKLNSLQGWVGVIMGCGNDW